MPDFSYMICRAFMYVKTDVYAQKLKLNTIAQTRNHHHAFVELYIA
jgi:hypothetical protein